MTEKRRGKPKYDLNSQDTLNTIQALFDRGIGRISVLVRHSARDYHKNPRLEAFMGLTDAGKEYAFDMGCALPEKQVTLYASHFGRCIETAYLLDKGYTRSHGSLLPHPKTAELLTPFYIKSIEKTMAELMAIGSPAFIRKWMDGTVREDLIEDAQTTAGTMADFMFTCLSDVPQNGMAICVTHDWNIYPIREKLLGLAHETNGDIGYLDSVIFFEDKGQRFITSRQSDPVAL